MITVKKNLQNHKNVVKIREKQENPRKIMKNRENHQTNLGKNENFLKIFKIQEIQRKM